MDEPLLYFAAVRGSESRVWQHVTWALTWGGPTGSPGEPLLRGPTPAGDGGPLAERLSPSCRPHRDTPPLSKVVTGTARWNVPVIIG